MPFALQRLDVLEGIEANGAIRPAVEVKVALPIALQAVFGDPALRDRPLGHTAVRAIDGNEPACRQRGASAG
jgi:hypothetical protein